MRIFLMRHGFSEGNENPENYIKRGDPQVHLTETGWQQAIAAGRFLKNYLAAHPGASPRTPRLWVSGYVRTRETAAGLIYGMDNMIPPSDCRVSSHLVEQDFGLFCHVQGARREQHFPLINEFYRAARARNVYYARPPMGESPMDVQNRTAHLIGPLMADRAQHGVEDAVLVTHGVSLRVFAMAFLQIDPVRYTDFKLPENGSIYLIEGDHDTGWQFRQIYDGAAMRPVNIDWGARLGAGKVELPPVPAALRDFAQRPKTPKP